MQSDPAPPAPSATPPRFHHRVSHRVKSFVPLLRLTAEGWVRANAMRLSAALALYTILSLAPLLVITTKIVGVALRNKDHARERVTDQITDLMGSRAAQAVGPMIEGGRQGGGLLAAVVSTAVLLFSATGVFAELQDSMNTIWGVKPRPNLGVWNFVRNRLLSLAMVFGTGFLLLVSVSITTVIDRVAGYFSGGPKWVALVLDPLVSMGMVSVLFAGIFKFLPDVKLAWRHVWAGAALTAGLFTAGKYGLALYFRLATPTSAFGAAGSLAAVMLWVYYSSFILFFGAEFTRVWSVRHLGARVVPEENAVKVTEEDLAHRGIPSAERMADALASQPLEGPAGSGRGSATGRSNLGRGGKLGPGAWTVAAGGALVGVVAGIVAGAFGARYLLGPQSNKATHRRRSRRR